MMKKLTEKEALKLLRKHFDSEEAFKKVLKHSKAVQKAALNVAKDIPDVDVDFIKMGSLLHDIGRSKHPPGKGSIKHGVAGAEILRKEGFEDYALVAERHLGVGISKEDIIEQGLDLPAKDYIPVSKEEKIIAYADNLVFGDEIKDDEAVVERFRKELGEKYAERVERFHRGIEKLKKKR